MNNGEQMMVGLPKETVFNKKIPKQKFYEKLDISPELKRVFIEQVKTIYWKNKIAVSTTNLAAGDEVTEIEIFKIHLNTKSFNEEFLYQIDREIPYHILFLLEYQGKCQAWIAYKEPIKSRSTAFKVKGYYRTDWLAEDKLSLQLEGLNLDMVYENFVRQIAGDKLEINISGETLKQSVEKSEQKQALQRQITTLQAKIRKEKQLNKQMQINDKIKKLKKELEDL